jgi:hypothetical protein
MVQSAWAILPRTLHGGDLMDGGRSVAGWSGIGWQALRLLVRIPTVDSNSLVPRVTGNAVGNVVKVGKKTNDFDQRFDQR